MKLIKLILVLVFSFISLQGLAPNIKNIFKSDNVHTIRNLGFEREESEYTLLEGKTIYLTDEKHLTLDELYSYIIHNSIFNLNEYDEYIVTFDNYSSSNRAGVFYLKLELLDKNDTYYKITFTIIVKQAENDEKYKVVPYDENIDYTSLNPINISLENVRLLSLKELFSLIQEKGIFDFDEYISLKVHKDTYSSSSNECGNYEIEVSLISVVEDDFLLKIYVVVTQSATSSTSYISSINNNTSSSTYSSTSSISSINSNTSSSTNSSISSINSNSSSSTYSSTSSSMNVSTYSSSSSEEIDYTKLNDITVEVYNDRIIPLFELYDIIEKQGIFDFSDYLEVIAYYDTYSTCNKKVGVYYIDVHMINIVEDTFEMRIIVIVRQNRSYDSSSSSASSSSTSLSSVSSSSTSTSVSSSSSNDNSSITKLPLVFVKIFNHRLLSLEEILSEVQRQGVFDFSSYKNILTTKDLYSSSRNKVGVYSINLSLEDFSSSIYSLEIRVIVQQDRSSKEIIPVCSLSFPQEEYTYLDTIKVDLSNMPFMNLYQICSYITQKGIYNFNEYLQILPIRDTYSYSELKDGTYYIDCELINIVEDTFIMTIEINISNEKKVESNKNKNFFETIFDSIKNFFINIFNSIKNIFKK